MSVLMKVTIVEDLSILCNIKEGESPLRISTYYPDNMWFGEDLEDFAVSEAEIHMPPTVAYGCTDVGGSPGLVEIDNREYAYLSVAHQSKTIVMAHYYEEV